jgi:membrane-associated protease RseP (regulator of RpoE activity)
MVLIRHSAAAALAVILMTSRAGAQPGTPGTLAAVGSARPLLYGFALECSNCTPGERGRGRGGAGGAPVVWTYQQYPRVAAVAPGSAAEEAGIRPGDILQSIDGQSLLTAQGATRFVRASKGEAVRLVFERESKPVSVTLMLGAGAASRVAGPMKVISGYMTLQGHVEGDVNIEVWSDDPILSQDSSNTLILRIGTSTIIKMRLKKDSTAKR